MNDPTRRLVQDAVAGDRCAREELLALHLPGLRSFVRLHAGPAVRARESSLDLVNSVCREALEQLDRFEYRGADSFRNWLLRQAENKIRDRGRFWRRERRSSRNEAGTLASLLELGDAATLRAQLETFCTPSRHASAREDLARAEAAFARLPPDYREVIVLARIQGLPHPQVAAAMGRSPVATRTLLSRALARMAILLEEPDDAGDPGGG